MVRRPRANIYNHMASSEKDSGVSFIPQDENSLQHFLGITNKVIFSSYVHLEKEFVNEFSYQNSGDVDEEVLSVLYHADGRRVAEIPPTKAILKPLQAFSVDVAPMLAQAGYTSFRGSILFIAHPLSETSQDLGQRDFASYWASTRNAWRNACHIGVGASKEMNVTGKKEKRIYNMFCPAVVSNERYKTLITIFNHSSEAGYSDTVSLVPVLHNLAGKKIEGPALNVGPWGTLLLDIDEVFKDEGRKLLAQTGGRGTATMIHKGHTFATLFFHIDKKTNEIVSGSHTTPAASIPHSYGVKYPLINTWSEKSPIFYLLWKFKHFR